MGRFRLTAQVRAKLWIVLGGLAASAGVGWQLGPGWGGLLGGAGAVAYGLLLVDVDEPKRGARG